MSLNKDAIHIATVEVWLDNPDPSAYPDVEYRGTKFFKGHKNLRPGSPVAIEFTVNGEDNKVWCATEPSVFNPPIGIIDPFLPELTFDTLVKVFIYPNTVKNLRHDWDHPNLDDSYDDYYDDGCRGC